MLLGSVVTYHALAKQKLLGVRAQTIELYSAESQQTTNEMALGLHQRLPQADVGVAVTGLRPRPVGHARQARGYHLRHNTH